MILLLAAAIWVIAFGIGVFPLLVPGALGRNKLKATAGAAPAGHTVERAAQTSRLRDILALGLVGGATAGFFWRMLAGQVWIPAGGGDLAQFLYPTFSFAANWWRQGIMPLWNPYLFGGAPFVGDIQSGIFYPLYLLTFSVSSPLTFRDMQFLSALHFYIAGAGMYLFLRFGRLGPSGGGLSRAPALAGAIAFEFSDLFVTHFGNLNLIAVAAWMPLVLLFYRRAVVDRRSGFAIAAGILLALAFLAGHIQSFLSIVMVLFLFALFHAFTAARKADASLDGPIGSRAFAFPLLMLVLTGLVAFGLSAPALLPSIEMTQHTLRAEYAYEQAARFSLPPAELIGLLVPGFFGRGPQNSWAPWDRVEVGYIGVLPLVLAFLALLLRRDALVRFWGLVGLIGLGLALGGYAILHGWLYQLIPGFGQLRAPARFVFVFDWAVAGLAAIALDYLLHALPRPSAIVFKWTVRAAPWVFLLIALTAGATAFSTLLLGQGQDPVLFARISNAANALAFFVLMLGLSVGLVVARGTRFFNPPVWAALAVLLIFFDLFSLGAYVDVSTENPTRVFEHPDAVAFLKSDPDIQRVDARGTGVDTAWPADTSILYGLFDVNGDNPLVLANFDRYWESLGSRSSPLYDLLNAKYLIGRKNVSLDRAKFRLAFRDDPAVDIFENTRVLPRAFLVYDKRVVADSSAAFAAIHAEDFDPARTVILEQKTGEDGPHDIKAALSTDVTISGYGPNEIRLDISASGPGVVVLSEIYYPGWRAWVDDREVDVLRADFLFRGVESPAGSHRIRLLFDPISFKIGQGLGLITAAILIALRLWKKRPT